MKSYKDVYTLPLKEFCGWVRDANENFVFQFLIENEINKNLFVNVINGYGTLTNPDLKFEHKDGFILNATTGQKIILIRGWGNLTGKGAMNLPPKEAANIQDTFAEFIVERLNKDI